MKSKYDFAREMHLTFASVGGGLLIALIAFRIYEYYKNPVEPFVVAFQFACIFILFYRLYWVYINTLPFFVPFDNLWLFILDTSPYLLGAMVILYTGHNKTWFFIIAFTQIVCMIRIWVTLRRAGEYRSNYPESLKKLKQTLPNLCLFMFGSVVIAVTFGILLIWVTQKVILNFIYVLVCYVAYFQPRYIEPIYPIEIETNNID